MTAEKVKALLESFAAVCGSNSKAKELCGDAIKFVEQQAQQLESIKALLPDKYSESKDWQASNTVNRIDWLKGMFEGKKLEIKQLEKSIEQQAQEIAKLQIREHRMIEYMRDIKNFAFTINEVANNAIEEAEVGK